MTKFSTFLLSCLISLISLSQSPGVAINNDGSQPHPSASLDVSGTQQGVLINRMTTEQRNAIANPAEGLLIFNTSSKCFEFFAIEAWHTGSCAQCPPVPAPASGSHGVTDVSIQWQWNAVPGATGYRYHTANEYSQATDAGQALSYFQSGLTCGTQYTLYVWAYSACGYSLPVVLNAPTTGCAQWTCGNPFADSRDGKVYNSVLIGSQCWMAQGLNFGTLVNSSVQQSDNSIPEKYCYSNDEQNCVFYGGFYQWGEAVQYLNGASNLANYSTVPSGHVQGVCPPDWHIPTANEVTALGTSLGGANVAGGKMKVPGFNYWDSPNSGADNSSGFTSLGAGNISGGMSTQLGINNPFWSSTPAFNNSPSGARFFMTSFLTAELLSGDGGKTYGYMVRCVKD